MSKAPEDLDFDYDTVQGLTGGLRNADRGHGGNKAGPAGVGPLAKGGLASPLMLRRAPSRGKP